MKQLNLYYLGGGGVNPDIPDGKTITPINDVTIWQKCAGLTPVYTTLGEVLNDSGITTYLMANDNAVDYMVRCTEWTQVTTVPTMTSDTTPEGTCFADNTSSGHAAYRAFDGISGYQQSESWASTSTNSKVGYIFPNAVEISRVNIQCPANVNTNELNAFKIQYSDDGTEWNDATDILYFVSSQPSTAQNKDYAINPVGKHRYWAILAISCYGNLSVIRVCEAQFYSISIPSSETAMKAIGASDYASNTLLNDTTWRQGIADSLYNDYIIKSLVPAMTSNTTPYGVVSASSYYTHTTSSYNKYPWYGYANDINLQWMNSGSPAISAGNQWIQYQLIERKNVKIISMRSSSTYTLYTFKFQGSNDGINFTDLGDVYTTHFNTVLDTQYFSIPNNTEYIYYRICPLSSNGNTYTLISCIQYYTRETGGVQTWLHSAGITNKNYTSLSFVLADTETLAILMSNQNAIDYLVTAKSFIADIVNNETAMGLIGANDYASNMLLEDSDWAKAICNSSYFETILNTNVPIMTSNTAPKGTAFSSSCLNDSSNSGAWRAFDRNISTTWHSAKGVPQYIGYDFTFGNIVNKVSARSSVLNSSYPNRTESYVIQGFDGTDWVDLSDTITHQFSASGDAPLLETAFANGMVYNQYRLYITNSTYQDNTNKYAIFTLIQFYGRRPYSGVQTLLRTAGITNKYYTTISQLLNDSATLTTVINSEDTIDYLVTAKAFINDICNNETAMTLIGNSNYASNTLLADSDWYNGICNSEYFESVLNVKVPIMTSNTTPSGTCIDNANSANAYLAFNDNGWNGGRYQNTYVEYIFPYAVKLYKAYVSHRSSTSTSLTFRIGEISASNDGISYNIIGAQNSWTGNASTGLHEFVWNFNNLSTYSHYKVPIWVSGVGADGNWQSGTTKVQFYGRKDV